MSSNALALVLVLAGCQNPSSSDSDGGGLKASLSGIVYDSATGLPLEGVIAQINNGKSATTNKQGTFQIDDVNLGTYDIVLIKDGYQPGLTAQVDASVSIISDYDGYLSTYELQRVLDALNAYANKPSGSGAWSYTEGGVWINPESGAAVTVSPNTYEITPFVLEGGYKAGWSLKATGLAPLAGYVEGTLKVIKTPFTSSNELKNQKMAEAVALDEGVEIYVEAVVPGSLGSAPIKYGPFKTGANGAFKLDKLPVGQNLTIRINGYTSATGNYTIAPSATYRYDISSNNFNNSFNIAAEKNGVAAAGAAQSYTHFSDFYLFIEGSYVAVSYETSGVGTPDAPLTPGGKIHLSFSKAIDTATFNASLKEGSAGNFKLVDFGYDTVPLAAAWAADNKSVDLTPQAAPAGYLRTVFPYSDRGNLPLGRLSISGKSVDGDLIFATTATDAGIPVYVEEGLKYLGAKIIPAPPRTSRVALKTSEAIELTYSKNLSSQVTVSLDSKVPDYEVKDNTLIVYADQLAIGATASLTATVYALADPLDMNDDVNYQNYYDVIKENQILALKSVSSFEWKDGVLEEKKLARTGGSIALTFTRNLPSDAVAKVDLYTGYGSEVPVGITKANDTVTISPAVPLPYDTTLYLNVEIYEGKERIFSAAEAAFYDGILLNFNVAIELHTVEDTSSISQVEGFFGDWEALPLSYYVNTNSVSNGTATVNKSLYIVFDNAARITTPNKTGARINLYNSSNPDFDFEVKTQTVGDKTALLITVKPASGVNPNATVYSGVYLTETLEVNGHSFSISNIGFTY